MSLLSPVTDKETEGLQRQNQFVSDPQQVRRKARTATQVVFNESAISHHRALSAVQGVWRTDPAACLWGDKGPVA